MLIPHTSPPCGLKNRRFFKASACLRKYKKCLHFNRRYGIIDLFKSLLCIGFESPLQFAVARVFLFQPCGFCRFPFQLDHLAFQSYFTPI